MNMSVTDFQFEEERLKDLSSGQIDKLDHQLNVTFYKHAELNSWASRPKEEGGEGRKIFEEFVYIRILMPANRLNVIERRATSDDIKRFARQYKAFIEKGEKLVIGTPLDQMPSLTSAQVLEFKSLNIDTVEQLAGIPDSTAQLLGVGGQDIKRRAQLFLDRATSNETLAAENRELREKLEAFLKQGQAAAAAASTPAAVVTAKA